MRSPIQTHCPATQNDTRVIEVSGDHTGHALQKSEAAGSSASAPIGVTLCVSMLASSHNVGANRLQAIQAHGG